MSGDPMGICDDCKMPYYYDNQDEHGHGSCVEKITVPEAVPNDHQELTIDVILEMAEKFKMPEPTHILLISQNMLDALNSKHENRFFSIKDGEQVGTDVIRVTAAMSPRHGIRMPYFNLDRMF